MANRSDDFDRADNGSSMGTPSDGLSAWQVLTGFGSTWGITSNQAYNVGGGNSRTALESSESDVEVQVTIPTRGDVGGGSVNGILFRATDDDNNLEFSMNFGNSMFIQKREAGSNSTLTSVSRAYADGDTFKVVTSGDDIECFHNGVSVLTATTSFNNTATKHGLRAQGGATRFDDFSITAGAAPSPALAPPRLSFSPRHHPAFSD
jgi:hypothetical protein